MSLLPNFGSLRLLVDEDVSHKLVKSLRDLGIDAKTDLKGLKNGELFKKIVSEGRIFLTHDNDFTDAIRYPSSKTSGLIIMRIHPPTKEVMLKALKLFFAEVSAERLRGKLVLLTASGFSIE